MADGKESEDNEHKCLIIANKSCVNIILYIYSGWAPFCWVSTISKIIKPNETYLYHEKAPFKFEIVAKSLDHKKKKKLLKPEKWSKDKVITITESLECQAKNLAKIENLECPAKNPAKIENLECQAENLAKIEKEKRLCLQEIYRKKNDEELAHADLYSILDLDMEEVRKKDNEDMKNAIWEAKHQPCSTSNGIVTYHSISFWVEVISPTLVKLIEHINTLQFDKIGLKWKTGYKQMQIWHHKEIIAYDVIAERVEMVRQYLMDDAKRASYHNKVHYDKGWLFPKFKAVFWSDCYTKEQKKAYWCRNGMFILSAVLAIGGVAVSVGTAGAAAPLVVGFGAALGGGFTGAGCLSLGHTMSKKSVVEGCDVKAWLTKAGFGFVGGAVTGGTAAGIAAGMVGIGSAAMEAGAVTAGQYVAMGSATGAVGGLAYSVASNAAKVCIGEEKVTAKQFFVRAAIGAAIGAAAGAVGGLVVKGIVDIRASAATSTLEGDALEQVPVETGASVADSVEDAVSKQFTIAGTKSLLRTASDVVHERLDDSVKNKKITEHLWDGVKNIFSNVLTTSVQYAAGTAAGTAAGAAVGLWIDEALSDEQSYPRSTATSNESTTQSYLNNNNEAHENIQVSGNETNEDQGTGKENGEPGNETNEEQEDDELEENMFKLSNVKGKKGMNTRKETGRPRNQSSNANRSKSESGRSHTTSEKGASKQHDQSYEEHSTQQNSHVVSEESIANQSSNGESYKENIDGCDGKSGILKPGFSGDVLTLGTGSAATESSAVCQYFAMGSVPGDVGEVVSLDAAKVIVDSGACAATSTLEGGAVEQVSALTEESGVGDAVAHPRQVTFAGTRHMLGTASKVVNECLDDQSSNAKRNKCERGRPHTTNENTTQERNDQSYEAHSTQQNSHVVSEESTANQSSNDESYEEKRGLSDEINEKPKPDEPDVATMTYRSRTLGLQNDCHLSFKRGKKHKRSKR